MEQLVASQSGATREEQGFRRTVCACEFCRAPCRHVPGGLTPADLGRLCPRGSNVDEWAEQHLRAVVGLPAPTLVPARGPEGHCHWLFEGRCAVHEHAPFGCAFFDSHQPEAEVRRRSAAVIAARREDAAAGGLHYRVWLHLWRRGLTERPGDRAGLTKELDRICRYAERRQAGREAAR
jgi:hypothetical protein